MNWGIAGIILVFAAFIVLLIFNPDLSCFGKRLKSPFYPLFRKKRTSPAKPAKQVKTTDYGFRLTDAGSPASQRPQIPAGKKTEDYGFKLD
jgi:hypothetical protein